MYVCMYVCQSLWLPDRSPSHTPSTAISLFAGTFTLARSLAHSLTDCLVNLLRAGRRMAVLAKYRESSLCDKRGAGKGSLWDCRRPGQLIMAESAPCPAMSCSVNPPLLFSPLLPSPLLQALPPPPKEKKKSRTKECGCRECPPPPHKTFHH